MSDALGATTQTEPLRLIGYWAINGRWASLREPVGWPHPKKLVGTKWQAGLKQKVASYLRSGHVVMRWQGYSSCRFAGCAASGAHMGSADLTDGKWYWPEGLAHYVEVHDVRLPDQFVQSMTGNGFVPPSVVSKTPRVDGQAWLDWCAQNTAAPEASADALSLQVAERLCERWRTPMFTPTVTLVNGRWRVGLGEREADYLPLCAASELERYLLSRRRVSPQSFLTMDEANGIARKIYGWWRVGRPRVVDESRGEGGDVAQWMVRCKTVTSPHVPTDELGWRAQLSLCKAAVPAPLTLDQVLMRPLSVQ